MFSQAIADKICEELANGRSLRSVCQDPDLPAATTVLGWVKENKAFAEQYTQARARQYELLADDMLEDTYALEPQEVAAARLRFDAKRWMLSKMLPKVYGDKLDVAHSGGVTVVMTPNDADL